MGSMVLKRLLVAVPSLIGVVIVTFLLTRALPGDPAAYFAGPAATKEAIEQIRVKLGLDQPLIVQFGNYVADLARGDLGTSLTTGQPVRPRSARACRPRRAHAARAARRRWRIAVPLGILAATRPGSLVDHACRVRGDRRRVAAGVLHRPHPRLCLLLPARLGAGAARPARHLLQSAAARHRLLPDRQRARRRLASCSSRRSSSSSCRRSRSASSRWRRSRA